MESEQADTRPSSLFHNPTGSIHMMDNIRQVEVAGRRSLIGLFLGESRGPGRHRSRRSSLVVEQLERRELLANTIQDFNNVVNNVPVTGTPYASQQFGDSPGPTVVNSAMQLTSATGMTTTPPKNQYNEISFDRSAQGTYNKVDATFQFMIMPGTGRGDGLSFALLNTDKYGLTGAAPPSVSAQKALFNGSLGIGFDTAQGPGDPSNNFVVVSFDAAPIGTFSEGVPDLASGSFITAAISVNFVAHTVSFTLTPTGSTTPFFGVINNVVGLKPYESRVNFTGTAVSSLATMDLDNVNVKYQEFRDPGSISFSSNNYQVPENGGDPHGYQRIEIDRNNGTAGSVSVIVGAADDTAINGVNYVAQIWKPDPNDPNNPNKFTKDPVVKFDEGDSAPKFVYVQIFDDHLANGDKTVLLYLGENLTDPNFPANQVSLGPISQATLTIKNTDSPAPTLRKVQLLHAPFRLRLQFSLPMDMGRAQNVGNYELILPPARKHGPKRTVTPSRAELNSSGFFVTLSFANLGRVHLTKLFQILVRGQPKATTGLTANGTYLAGTNNQSGTDALRTVSL